jgi:hypothetical protein
MGANLVSLNTGHRLKGCENKALRGIFGPEKNEVKRRTEKIAY